MWTKGTFFVSVSLNASLCECAFVVATVSRHYHSSTPPFLSLLEFNLFYVFLKTVCSFSGTVVLLLSLLACIVRNLSVICDGWP